VRVLGSKNRVARILPLSKSEPFEVEGSIDFAVLNI